MAWYNVLTYTPPAGSGAGSLGGVGGGWTDVGSKWQTNTVGGGRVIQIVDASGTSPWTNGHLVRKATAEQSVNQRVDFRWMTTAGSRGASPFVYLKYAPNSTDASPNGHAIHPAEYIPVTAGALGNAVDVGGTPTLAANAWFDTSVTITTSGGNATMTEQTWTVTNPFSDAFGSGSVVTNTTFPATSTFATVSGEIGLFAYQPGTLNVSQVRTYSDVPATALTVSPSSSSASAGQSVTFTVGTNGAQNGGAITFSDGGAGGSFAASAALAPGVGTTTTVVYTAGSASGTVTITASSSALTGSTISGTATLSVTAAVATGLTISPTSQSVNVGAATAAFTVTTNGTLSAATPVSLSDGGAGGTFSPTSLTFNSGTTSGTFTYTPAAGGTITLTATASGLSSATSTVTSIASATSINATDARVVASPNTWIPLSGGAVRTNRPGAYLRLSVSGVSSVAVNFGSGTNTGATFMAQVDDGVFSQPIACKNGQPVSVSLPDANPHTLTIMVQTLPQAAGRWDGSNAVVISGFGFGSGASVNTPAKGAKTLLIYGDSITEGTQAVDGSDGFRAGWPFVLGEALRRMGWEYGVHCAANSGISWTTPSSSGGQPAAWTSGNDAASAWNKLDGSGVAGAALTSGTVGGTSERFITPPDVILECWGANDGINNIADGTLTPQALGLLQRLRVAAPSAVILKVIPIGGYKRAALTAAVSQAADRRTLLVDLALDSRMTLTGYCGNLLTGAAGSQTVHPWSLSSAHIASIHLAAMLASYVPLATARAFGSAS